MKQFTGIFVLATVMMVSSLADAGMKWGRFPVRINRTVRVFEGDMGSARNSANTTERLNCQVSAGETWSFVSCWANDEAGNSVSCSSFNSFIISAVQAVQTDSRVSIYYDDTGKCTQVYTHVDSGSVPKLP